jgi:hypothetical protein
MRKAWFHCYLLSAVGELTKRLDGDPRRRIVDVLKWYRYHHHQKYVPQFTSAKAFVTKFFQLE